LCFVIGTAYLILSYLILSYLAYLEQSHPLRSIRLSLVTRTHLQRLKVVREISLHILIPRLYPHAQNSISCPSSRSAEVSKSQTVFLKIFQILGMYSSSTSIAVDKNNAMLGGRISGGSEDEWLGGCIRMMSSFSLVAASGWCHPLVWQPCWQRK
jgi:hypothetical protein